MMEYQLQVTLKKIEVLNSNIKSSKIIASLTQGDCTKRIANPRFIRNRMGSFYLERLTVSTHEISEANRTVSISLRQALLQIWAIQNSGEEEEIGSVDLDVAQLVKEAEKTSTKAESHRCQLENIILEFDTLVSVKKNQQSYLEDDSQQFFSEEQQSQQTKKSRENPVKFIDQPEVKDDKAIKELTTLEHQLYDDVKGGRVGTKLRDIKSNATPPRKEVDSSDPDLSPGRGEQSERIKITRRDSGTANGYRTNVFVSKKKPKQEQASKSSSLLAVPILQEDHNNNADIDSRRETPQPDTYEDFSDSSPNLRETTPAPHNTSLDKALQSNGSQAQSPESTENLNTVIEKNEKTTTPRPFIPSLANPQSSLFDRLKKLEDERIRSVKAEEPPKLNSWRKNLPEIEVPEYSPVPQGLSIGKQVSCQNQRVITGRTPPPLIRLVSAPTDPDATISQPRQNSRLSMRPRKSSFRRDKDKLSDQSSLLRKEVHVHYTPEVAIREIDDRISRLEGDFSRKDVKRNIILGLVSLAIGFFIGGL